MNRFLTQLTIFGIPAILFFLIPTLILWISKENFHQVDKILASNEKYLIGYAYNNGNNRYLKWTKLNNTDRKTVWALGTSRVLQFRENLFDSTYYNAGTAISSTNEFLPFLKSLPTSKYPKYMVISIDQFLFNQACDSLKTATKQDHWQTSFTLFPDFITNFKLIFTDLFEGKIKLMSLFNSSNSIKNIGLNALMKNNGFRNDGSRQHGDLLNRTLNKDTINNDSNFFETYTRIKLGINRFQYGKDVNPAALVEVDEFLKFCKQHNIIVIGFLPPLAEKVYQRMEESGNYTYLQKIFPSVYPIFNKYQYECYDFTRVKSCNSNDNEMLDGFHGGDRIYHKMMIAMLDSGSVLNEVANVERLRTDLKNRGDYCVIYE